MNKDTAVLEFLFFWDRPINSGTLRKELNLKHSTLNSVIERLVKRGFVEWKKYSLISLTEDGKKEAGHISNHHFIVEKFLTDTLDLKEEDAHKEALKISPHVSCKIIEAICMKMHVSHTEIHTQFCTERDYLS